MGSLWHGEQISPQHDTAWGGLRSVPTPKRRSADIKTPKLKVYLVGKSIHVIMLYVKEYSFRKKEANFKDCIRLEQKANDTRDLTYLQLDNRTATSCITFSASIDIDCGQPSERNPNWAQSTSRSSKYYSFFIFRLLWVSPFRCD